MIGLKGFGGIGASCKGVQVGDGRIWGQSVGGDLPAGSSCNCPTSLSPAANSVSVTVRCVRLTVRMKRYGTYSYHHVL